ncbi:Uncharacterised protein [Vibrio cholerae]|nr:Uncharacterised protein [Vibrio cholerae]
MLGRGRGSPNWLLATCSILLTMSCSGLRERFKMKATANIPITKIAKNAILKRINAFQS